MSGSPRRLPSNTRTMRLLVVVFIALLAVSYLVNRVQQNLNPPTGFPTAPPEVFPGLLPQQITRIEVQNTAEKHTITLVKVPGDWRTTDEKGAAVKVDPALIVGMIQNLASLRYNRVMEGSDVKAFGLANGGLFVVQFDAGRSYTLHIGDSNSDGTFAFVQRGTDPKVLQVSTDQVYPLIKIVFPQTG